MNPYNFVRLRPMAEDARQEPVGHKRLVTEHAGERVVSGRLECQIVAFGPIIILHHDDVAGLRENEHKVFRRFFHLPSDERPVIPATSLKGMVRAVAEAASNSCLSILNEQYGNRWPDFEHSYHPSLAFCGRATTPGVEGEDAAAPKRLCPACRIFGTAPEGEESGSPRRDFYPYGFRSKVRFSDAVFQGSLDNIYERPATLIALLEPKVTQNLWYFDRDRGGEYSLAGRKFYYHHDDLRPKTTADRSRLNATVTPLKPGSRFTFQVDFENLLLSELRLLLYALELKPAKELVDITDTGTFFRWQEVRRYRGVYHKLGYGKPAGLGSVCILATRISTLRPVDRYKDFEDGGWTRRTPAETRKLVTSLKQGFTEANDEKPYLQDLQAILRYPNGIRGLRYPSINEFKAFKANMTKLQDPP